MTDGYAKNQSSRLLWIYFERGKYRYLYVVTPLDEQGDDQSEWSGGLSVIKNQIKSETERMQADLTAETKKLIGKLEGIQLSLDEWKQS